MPERDAEGWQALGLAVDCDFWVFAYGSLMWNPGFAYAECRPALLRGYHRRFCILSTHYRGTPERPGLVLGLDRGGSCRGLAFRIAAETAQTTLADLWDREMITAVYRPRLVSVRTQPGAVDALAFIVDRGHEQYCGRLSVDEAADRIACACGGRGPNLDYLANTVTHLQALGIRDRQLETLWQRALTARRVPAE